MIHFSLSTACEIVTFWLQNTKFAASSCSRRRRSWWRPAASPFAATPIAIARWREGVTSTTAVEAIKTGIEWQPIACGWPWLPADAGQPDGPVMTAKSSTFTSNWYVTWEKTSRWTCWAELMANGEGRVVTVASRNVNKTLQSRQHLRNCFCSQMERSGRKRPDMNGSATKWPQ